MTRVCPVIARSRAPTAAPTIFGADRGGSLPTSGRLRLRDRRADHAGQEPGAGGLGDRKALDAPLDRDPVGHVGDSSDPGDGEGGEGEGRKA